MAEQKQQTDAGSSEVPVQPQGDEPQISPTEPGRSAVKVDVDDGRPQMVTSAGEGQREEPLVIEAEEPNYLATDDDDDEQDMLLGAVLADRYRVLRVLGVGGMGTVYLAEHVTIEKKIAIKVLLPELARRKDIKERFLQEARAAARIGHPNIVDITDYGTIPQGSAFFAMEYLDGSNMGELIGLRGRLPWPRIRRIMLQICQALQAAHVKGIIHRDMKPENIVLVERGGNNDFIKVLDFGIAKMDLGGDGPRLTQTGMVLGTPEYMSPEQAQGQSLDHRVDIYAVGIIMYEMLTGKVPFKADTFMGTLTQHIFKEPVPPSQVDPSIGITPEVEAVVLKAMAKDLEHRFGSMEEFAQAVEELPDQMTLLDPAAQATVSSETDAPTATPSGYYATAEVAEIPEEPRRDGRARVFLAGGAVAVAVLALLGILLLKSQSDTPLTDKPSGTSGQTITPPPVEQRFHEISVNSVPKGALIHRGDQVLGKTPSAVRIKHGVDEISLLLKLDGYQDHLLKFAPDRRLGFVLQLKPEEKQEDTPKATKPDAGNQVAAAKKKPPRKRPPRKRPRPGSKKPSQASKKPDPASKKPKQTNPKPRPGSKLDKLINPFDNK